MLLIQNISLSWAKTERTLEAAKVRQGFSQAYEMGDYVPKGFQPILEERLYFYQRQNQILSSLEEYMSPQNNASGGAKKKHSAVKSGRAGVSSGKSRGRGWFQTYGDVRQLNLTNITVVEAEHGLYEVSFHYDERRSGQPIRRGSNKSYWDMESPLYRQDILNETAFILRPREYGRIMYNERCVGFDDGEWLYRLNIMNFINDTKEKEVTEKAADSGFFVHPDIFMSKKVDHIYKQLADLF